MVNRTIRQRAQAAAKKQYPDKDAPNMLTGHILRKMLEKAWMIGFSAGRKAERKAREYSYESKYTYDFRGL